MSTKKITSLTELSSAPAATDMAPIVDVSDTTDAATGTTKKITATNFCKGVGIGAGNTTAEPLKIDTSAGKVGIGLTSPVTGLHLQDHSLAISTNVADDASYHTMQFRRSKNATDGAHTAVDADCVLGQLTWKGSDGDSFEDGAAIQAKATETWSGSARGTEISFHTVDKTTTTLDEKMVLDDAGNLGLGTGSFGTNAARVLGLQNGTAPASSPSNGVQLYAQDVSTSELRVRDEAGNVTTLSPHNFDLLGERSDPMAWSYYAKNVFVGKELSVDMMKVIRALEKLTGETYIKVKNLKKSEILDWDTEEKKKEEFREEQIAVAKKEKKTVPSKYIKKSKPSWIG